MIQQKLQRFANNEIRFDNRHYGLRDISVLLEHFGNPHLDVPAFHIAGTNGKGSVAYMLNAILTGAGYRTGLYTSPHLLEINERIRLDNSAIDNERFGYYIDEITTYIDACGSVNPTFFDVLTVCAFLLFSECNADCAIIETGLGGRLDSTNIITPLCSIITDISYDHVGILGNTLSAISREKAGIIKNGVPVVTSNKDPEILGPITSAADSSHAPLYIFSQDFHAENIIEMESGLRFDYSLEGNFQTSMEGIEVFHPLLKQVVNASCSITASVIARGLFPKLTDTAIMKGLAAFSAPGRFQTLCRNPLLIFDPAHNEAALSEMVLLLTGKFPGRAATLVLSLMKDKEINSIMSRLASLGMKAVYFILDDRRCFVPREGDYSSVITRVVNMSEGELFSELDRLVSDRSLFFFTGSFRLYRTALDYAEHVTINCT